MNTWRQLVPKWLCSPWAIAISVILGVYCGLRHPQIAASFAPVGTLYLALLKMCVLPILLTAITGSIGRLIMSRDAAQSVRRILIVFPLGLLLVSTISVLIAAIAAPGRNLSEATLKTLGVLVNQSGIDLEIALTGPVPPPETVDVGQFVLSMVPDNIFSALSEGETLKVLVFSIVFGVSIGFVRESVTSGLLDVLDSIYKACQNLISGLTLLLPIGLCSLLASQLSQLGIEVLFAMVNFVIVSLLTFGLLYCICTLIIWRQTPLSLPRVLSALKEPTILALATSSSLTCIPASISALSNALKFDRQTTYLVTPLAITICRYGSVVYFALAALFVAQLYQKPLDPVQLSIVLIAAILAGMATSGATGVLTLTMLDIVLTPLKLPLEAVLVLFVAIDPIINPFRTLSIVHTGLAATSVIVPNQQEQPRLSLSTPAPES
jgi:proton glutamate symport protein